MSCRKNKVVQRRVCFSYSFHHGIGAEEAKEEGKKSGAEVHQEQGD